MAYVSETYHEYRITNPAGTDLGLLQNVKSEFTYNREINTSFVEIRVDVMISADVAPLSVDSIDTESGLPIATEANETITIERQPDVVGSTSSKAMIQNNNRVQVYEYSTWYPNGLLVFDGYINKWSASFGGNDIVTFTARSLADDMNDFIISGGNYTAELTQSSFNTDSSAIPLWNKFHQYFVATSTFLLKRVKLQARISPLSTSDVEYIRLSIWNAGQQSPIQIISITNTVFEDVYIEFTIPYQITLGLSYVMDVYSTLTANHVDIKFQNTGDVYTGGVLRYEYYGSGAQYTLATSDLYFTLYSQVTSTDYVFDNATASEIAQAGMDNYISKGGLAYYDSTDTNNFPTQTEINDYTFKAATILEVQKKALSLSTDDIYYKVDPGSQLYFFGKVTTATNGVGTIHKLILGKHFKQVEVGASVDEVRNVVSFTGGDVGGGVNLFTEYSDLTSIATQGRQRLERVVDNRVTIANTADSIAAAILAAKSEEKNFGTVEVLNSVYNTRLIEVGHAVQFKGIGNFLEDELYTVVSQSLTPDSMILGLGFIPNRLQDTIDKLIDDVQQIQTINNPDAPS